MRQSIAGLFSNHPSHYQSNFLTIFKKNHTFPFQLYNYILSVTYFMQNTVLHNYTQAFNKVTGNMISNKTLKEMHDGIWRN